MTRKRGEEQPGGRAPAPGALAVVQAFLNSADLEDGIERFDSPNALRQWFIGQGLLEASAILADRDLARAVAVREALRDLLGSRRGEPAAGEASARLNDALGDAALAVRMEPNGTPRLVPRSAGLDGALAGLMAIVYRSTADGSWERLKTCRNAHCRWVFFDASKNRSGAWCAMAICGAKRKARAYRRRGSSPTGRQRRAGQKGAGQLQEE